MAVTVAKPSHSAGGIPRLRPGSIPFLSYGFRPFFLGAAIWACAAMILWIGLLVGTWSFAATYGAVGWHAHEFLFGYVPAVMTGFLLTAIPNWTGRLPLQGRPLLVLICVWAVGRAAMLLTDVIGSVPAAAIDAAYLFMLTAVILREIVAGKNWRNLKVVALTTFVATANLVFHAEVIRNGTSEYGVRIGLAAIVLLIVLVGGRVTPSFTHNWLARRGEAKRPAPLGRYDMLSVGVTAFALVIWIVMPDATYSGAALLFAGILQIVRLSRWAGLRSWREPIVLILHVGYAFVPLGALTLAVSIFRPDILPASSGLHVWTAGAIGTMTLAIMTRATRGHTGRDIISTPATNLIYIAILGAVIARIVAPLAPGFTTEFLYVSAFAWIVSFGTFVVSYGRMLLGASRPSHQFGC
jgi:uncharacterized protein involved in response to NO